MYDSHSDTPTQLLRLRDIGLDNAYAHVDFPKLRRGGVEGSFFALYTPASLAPDAATRYALQMIASVQDAVEAHPDCAAWAFSPEDAALNRSKGLISIFLGMENAAPIQESLPLLRLFYRLGVRYLTLTHNGDNAVADCAAEGRRWGGLSPFGREVVDQMNCLGMMVDLSHVSDQTFWECIRLSRAPVIASHSCCRALCNHRRNLTDEMLQALGEKEGYVVKEIVDHIDHAVRWAGPEHVGIGSDFDGILLTPRGLEDVSRMACLWDEMRRRGYSETQIKGISGGNLMAVFERVIKCSESAN